VSTTKLFDAQAQRLLDVLWALPVGLRIALDSARVTVSTGVVPRVTVWGGPQDTASEVVRMFARDFVRCCRAFAEDEHQDPERRAEWAEWARRVEEVLDDGDR
jgi:hypothetical protein